MPKGLPSRWRLYHGAYRYRVPRGQEHAWDGKTEFLLGRTLTEAYKVWAERIAAPVAVTTIADLLERYVLEVIPKKAPRTQIAHRKIVPTLVQRFGHMALEAIEPQHVYEYVSKSADRLTAAHREVEVLSHALTMAVQWGLMKRHPLKGQVVFQRELQPKARERYVEDWEIIEVLSLSPSAWGNGVRMCQAYIRLKLLTGLRMTDMLRLPATFGDKGIEVRASKTSRSTGRTQRFLWTPELRAAVAMALEARPIDIAPWLFCSKKGECYVRPDNTVKTFGNIWNDFMRRCLDETNLRTRFAERDLRAKVASDADSLERARELLGHADARLTQRVYVRKPVDVKPARGIE